MAGRNLFATEQTAQPAAGRNLFAEQAQPVQQQPEQPIFPGAGVIEPAGFIESVGESLEERNRRIQETLQASKRGDIGAVQGAIQSYGQVLGGATDVAGEAISSAAETVSEYTPEPVKSFLSAGYESFVEALPFKEEVMEAIAGGAEAYQEWKEENPNAAKTFESGLNIAGGAATLKAVAPAVKEGVEVFTRQSPLKQKLAQQIEAGETDKKLAQYQVSGAGKLQKDPLAQETVKQGFDEGVIAAIKGSTPSDQAKMAKMVQIMRKGKQNALYATKNRPSDIAGNSLLERVNYVKRVNKEAGKKLDDVAKSLRGQQGDFIPSLRGFMDDVDEMGIKFDKKGQPDFRGSDIEGLAGPEGAIKNIVNRLHRVKRKEVPDAYEMHRLKKYIDEQVTYGKSAEGLSGKTERILKRLRTNLDDSLDANFPNYNNVNSTYSDTIQALDSIQDVAGRKMDLSGKHADKAIGTLLRRMMSNVQSRVNLVDAVDNIEATARKYGSTFDDDIATQMLFADELDSVFGAVARTSLAGETGKAIRKGAETATGRRGMFETAADVGEAAIRKARGINEEGAFNSIESLLTR